MGHKSLCYLALWLSWSLACFAKTNITIKDTDPRIVYNPLDHWRTSTIPCPRCLDPSSLGDITWHDGSFLVDAPTPSDLPARKIPDRKTTAESTITSRRTQETSNKRRRIATRADDSDMSLSLQFNGSAVYLYAIVPMGKSMPSTPTAMNLTFILDDAVVDHFVHESSTTSNTTTGFIPSQEIFSSRELPQDVPHTLQVNIGPNSVLLLDRIIYTQVDEDPPSDADRKKKIGTFAGAVAGSFGVFILLATGLGISLIRRRRRALRREQEERVDQPGNPTEFTPRYFPGTLPPPYSESPSVMRASPTANHVTIPGLSTPSISRTPSRTTVSPIPDAPTPLGANDPGVPAIPPPTFTEAISDRSSTTEEYDIHGLEPIRRDPAQPRE